MKKVLFGLGFVATISLLSGSANASFYEAPNMGNLNFYPLMQYQMEKQETLDYANDPEHYRDKRDKKNAELDVNSKFNPHFKTHYSGLTPKTQTQMEFVKDASGNIKIQGIK